MLKRNDKRKLDKILKKNEGAKLFDNVVSNFNINIEILEYMSTHTSDLALLDACNGLSKFIDEALNEFFNPVPKENSIDD